MGVGSGLLGVGIFRFGLPVGVGAIPEPSGPHVCPVVTAMSCGWAGVRAVKGNQYRSVVGAWRRISPAETLFLKASVSPDASWISVKSSPVPSGLGAIWTI